MPLTMHSSDQLQFIRGRTAPRCSVILGSTLAGILETAGIQDFSAALFADLSLGAWTPNQIAKELRAQLGLESTPPCLGKPLRGSTAELIGILIDRETTGHQPTIRTIEAAGQIAAALARSNSPRSIIVLAPLDGSALGEDNELFLGWLAAAEDGVSEVIVAARERPHLPEHWLISFRQAAPRERPVSAAGPLPPFPGCLGDTIVECLVTPEKRVHLRPLAGGAWLLPPELRNGSPAGAISAAERELLAQWPVIAPDPWLRAFASIARGSLSDELIPLGWRALSEGSNDLALRLVEAAISQDHSEESRASKTAIAQGMRIGIQDFEAVARESDPAPHLPLRLRGQLLQHKGWGLVMTGRAAEAASYFKEARALLQTDPATREFLYLLNITALVHLRCNDLERAMKLETEIERMLHESPTPDWHLIYINSLNKARLHLRLGETVPAAALFVRAFDTSRGCWTIADSISQNIYAARVAESGQDRRSFEDHWLKAALIYASDPMPEAIPARLAKLILGRQIGPRHTLAEAVSEAFHDRLLELFQWSAPSGQPPAVLSSANVPMSLFADADATAIGCAGWAVIASPRQLPSPYDGPAHRKLRLLVRDILAAQQPLPALRAARTLIIDDQLGRGIPNSISQLLDVCLRLGIRRGWFDGEQFLADDSDRTRLEERLQVAWGPAVSFWSDLGDEPYVEFRRYLPRRALQPDEARILRAITKPLEVQSLRAHAKRNPNLFRDLRVLECARVLTLCLAEDDGLLPIPSAETKERFGRQGFVKLEGFASPDEITLLSAYVDHAIQQTCAGDATKAPVGAGRRGDAERGVLVWLRHPERHALELANCFVVRRARRFAAGLLQVPENQIEATTRVFFKPPRTGSVVPWHQDAAFQPPERQGKLSLNIWVPLDDAAVENGCLHFVVGSHRGAIQPHRPYPRDPSGLTLETTPGADQEIVACPVNVGDASAHHCRTLHQSAANLSDRPRRALVVVCEVAGGPSQNSNGITML